MRSIDMCVIIYNAQHCKSDTLWADLNVMPQSILFIHVHISLLCPHILIFLFILVAFPSLLFPTLAWSFQWWMYTYKIMVWRSLKKSTHASQTLHQEQPPNVLLYLCEGVCTWIIPTHSVRMSLVTHSSLRAQRRLVGEPYLQRVCVSSWYSLSATLRGIPSQARMRMTTTAFWQQWPARCRTRHSNFSSSLPRRMICRI